MLQELYISNFVLIDKVTVKLCERLNVFSGATGVGKSLIIGALNFILGGRFSPDIIRSGKNEATVIAKFYISDHSFSDKEFLLDILGDSNFEEELLLRRSIDANGRSKCRLNDIPITVTTLKRIGESLVTIHGQHEHETLLQGSNQLYILDDFGGTTSLREEFTELHRQITEKKRFRDELKKNLHEKREKIDLYTFQINEIDKAQLNEAEEKELERERSILCNAEKIKSTISSCYSQLYESSDAVVDKLKSVVRELQSIESLDQDIQKICETCGQLLYQIEDVAFTLNKYSEGFDFDPQKLEYTEERLNMIRKLKSKYGETIEDILSYRNEIDVKLKQLTGEGFSIENLDEELKSLLELLEQRGNKLTKKRMTTAEKLAPLINNELHDLGIPHGKFQVEIKSPFIQGNGAAQQLLNTNSSGVSKIDFLISPNPGEILKPLKKIASGGEISRVMLALKHQLAKVDKTPVLVFDEIDANIGGRMGEVIGEKLSDIAQTHQVICITHLPQIACYADGQWKVNKFVKDGKTYSKIENLKGADRVEEIADMIRGAEKTDTTRKQAREMLQDAKKRRKTKR